MEKCVKGMNMNSEIIIYQTVWLSIDQMAELFQCDRSVIGKHFGNIFKKDELEKSSE